MTREKWTKVALEIAPHLEEIRRIAKRHNVDGVSMSANYMNCGRADAVYVDDSTEVHYGLDIDKEGIARISKDFEIYYTKIN